MKRKNLVAAQSPKAKKKICKGLQAEVMDRLQNKGLTKELAQEIIQSRDDVLAGVMVDALKEALQRADLAQVS